MTDLGWLDAIEARLRAATPGPWATDETRPRFITPSGPIEIDEADWGTDGHESYVLVSSADPRAWSYADTRFVAHAPEDIAALVAAVRERDAEIEDLRDEMSDMVRKDWPGLAAILEHCYPEDVFPTLEDNPSRDLGPRVVSLLRMLQRERAALAKLGLIVDCARCGRPTPSQGAYNTATNDAMDCCNRCEFEVGRDLTIEAETRAEKAEAALARVEALHRPSADGTFCDGCWQAGGFDGAPLWPCPTRAALADPKETE